MQVAAEAQANSVSVSEAPIPATTTENSLMDVDQTAPRGTKRTAEDTLAEDAQKKIKLGVSCVTYFKIYILFINAIRAPTSTT